ncbi:UDP-glucose--hexose-1-phosphate uridylyltransferase [Eubacterium oxidoreducens]|uniref:Galactose-1-phosphate uridylyltransferase n=1 Tax=Eubacterium oxidoreducens TaxID=1732 RepID=A0A1G6CGV1_EUBOX|nr:UDP-glucose--hexose-1-phosphate uridylyltransferase [Eubacterium oxidoreducens]SDB32134.1 UDPglucose--hexose-1-phosphate uridylyltransferase [Eubacterium oxidoreducens]
MQQAIWNLAQYGIETGLMKEEDRQYAMNLILDVMKEDELKKCIPQQQVNLSATLEVLLDAAVQKGLIEDHITDRDLFDTRLMNCLMPRPSEVVAEFDRHYTKSPQDATQYFYKLSIDSHYIRSERVQKDRRWSVESKYGTIDISINLSKPEKNPKDIAAAKNAKQADYPKCMLCMENEGYAGRGNFPARQNHRIIPITIDDKKWGLQYSPYVYYNEHCIVFNGEHTPMQINRRTFVKLFDFIKLFPHYFLGSNADLPIVGGSILSHDHFQGGHYEFAMERASYEETFVVSGFEDVEAGIVNWPLSVIRIRHKDANRLIDLADHILKKWRDYTDEQAYIYAQTDGERHNTITPIARCKEGVFELDLALRNNITTERYPLGLYHPHQEYHHIKQENIGLIEVMGLAVLPARLDKELTMLEEAILTGKDLESNEMLKKHAAWAKEILEKYDSINADNIHSIIEQEVGQVFVHVLEDAGVYKCTKEGREAFRRFIQTL